MHKWWEYHLGERVDWAAQTYPYLRQAGEPLYRPLQIYTIDLATSRLEGATATVKVPYEPLKPGPAGALFCIDDFDESTAKRHDHANLETPHLLLQSGYGPSPSNFQFHQQMVYAVCSLVYGVFRKALGRDLGWAFHTGDGQRGGHLRIRPHAREEENAFYDPARGELCFGYYRAKAGSMGRTPPHGFVFTCLSHDIVAHELTHALLDGLRAHFTFPSGPDVLAFHEAFADLVAIFQHFTYEEVVRKALGAARGQLEQAGLLVEIARQFGHTTGAGGPLRSPIAARPSGEQANGEATQADLLYAGDHYYESASLEPHTRGSLLTSAVFDAFLTIYQRKTARYVRLATNGSGLLSAGELPVALQEVLAEEARQLAQQFLAICIRAVDYCPVVDLELGEYLRAVITADRDLVPDDPWAYREAWIDAFRRRGIYPRQVDYWAEEELLWQPPSLKLDTIRALSFAQLQFASEPGRPVSVAEARRQAHALGQVVAQRELLEVFGCTWPGHPDLRGDEVDPPRIESIRPLRRVGPDGQVIFDLVAEVTQRRRVQGRPGFDFFGGATVLIDPQGEIRYTILKRITNQERLDRQCQFMQSEAGRQYWLQRGGQLVPSPHMFRLLHKAGGGAIK